MLHIFNPKIVTKVYGAVSEQRVCKIRSSQELGELCKILYLVFDIIRSLEWLEYTIRLDQIMLGRDIVENRPESRKEVVRAIYG
jgi:hypothetical protein